MSYLRLKPLNSSLIREYRYLPLHSKFKLQAPGQGFLLVTLQNGDTWAYLVPGWLPGILSSSYSRGRSMGAFYNRHVKGRLAVKIKNLPKTNPGEKTAHVRAGEEPK